MQQYTFKENFENEKERKEYIILLHDALEKLSMFQHDIASKYAYLSIAMQLLKFGELSSQAAFVYPTSFSEIEIRMTRSNMKKANNILFNLLG